MGSAQIDGAPWRKPGGPMAGARCKVPDTLRERGDPENGPSAMGLRLSGCWPPLEGLGARGEAGLTSQPHLPMQKRLNTRSSTASLTSSPVIAPRLRTASRRSIVQKSQGSSAAAASRLRARLAAAAAARSR